MSQYTMCKYMYVTIQCVNICVAEVRVGLISFIYVSYHIHSGSDGKQGLGLAQSSFIRPSHHTMREGLGWHYPCSVCHNT